VKPKRSISGQFCAWALSRRRAHVQRWPKTTQGADTPKLAVPHSVEDWRFIDVMSAELEGACGEVLGHLAHQQVAWMREMEESAKEGGI
jgi:hypothetical protein